MTETRLPPSVLKKAEEIVGKENAGKAVKNLEDAYSSYAFEPGEAIGIVAAQSISEPTTQMAMRTYHVAGSAGIRITLGLPRLMEIFDARREPATPMMTIYLEKDYQTKEKAGEIADQINEVKVGELAAQSVIDILNGTVEIKLDMKAVARHRMSKPDIVENLGKAAKDIEVKTREDTVVIKPKKADTPVRDLQKLKYKAMELHVGGIKGVSQVVIRREEKEWVINTLGSNLKKVLAIDGVDAARTYCNDIFETAKVFGIEAARTLIINEAAKTMKQQGLDVDIRHIMLVADIMTLSGKIKAIGRYGVAGMKGSVLARAAFEETIKHLTAASISGERDMLDGVVENVMIGRVVPVGTGMFDLVAAEAVAPQAKEREKT